MVAAPQQITSPLNNITRQIIAAAMKVHTLLGPGLLESAYHACLVHELRKQGVTVASQVGLPVVYDGEKIDLAKLAVAKVGTSIRLESWQMRQPSLRRT